MTWEEVTAVSTLVLALVTWRLARATRRLAAEANTERRANWQPVLVPDVEAGDGGIAVDGLGLVDGTLSMRVRNIGRGPALKVRAALWDESVDETVRKVHRGHAAADVIAPGEDLTFEWKDFDPPAPPKIVGIFAWAQLDGALTYGDVGDRRYDTEVKVGFRLDAAVSLIDHQFLGAAGDRISELDRRKRRVLIWILGHANGPNTGRLRDRLAHRLARAAVKRLG